MRFVTPSSFVLALAMMFLPWVDIRCDLPGMGTVTVATQKGFETITGKVDQGELPGQGMGGKQAPGAKEKKLDKVDSAVLVIAWAGLAAAGVVLGLVLPPSGARKALLGLCAVAAVACLVAQAFVLKFPITKEVDKEMDAAKAALKQGGGAAGGAGGANVNLGGLGGVGNAPQPEAKTVLRPGFWLAVLLTAAALVGVAMEGSDTSAVGRRRREEE
jgi:hypothetical protein